MASALTVVPSSARAIEKDLAALWSAVAKDGPVARASMSNLVIVSDAADQHSPGSLLEDPVVSRVARRHPARIIALEYEPGERRACGPSEASVGVLTFGDGKSRFGVEMIAVHVSCAERSLPSIVRALARGDVPTTIWWIGDVSAAGAARVLFKLGQQLVYDSRDWRHVKDGLSLVAQVFADGSCPDLADLNWRRLASVRSVLRRARAGQTLEFDASQRDAAAPWLIAGWLTSRGSKVEWTEGGMPVTAGEHIDEAQVIAEELHSLRRDHELRDSVLAAAKLAAS
jgi:glucose-6-phosphate dehydrogenase assembly protein OpcA